MPGSNENYLYHSAVNKPYAHHCQNMWHSIKHLKHNIIVDVGGNDGTFVRRITSNLDLALVCDIDNNAVDYNYTKVKKNKEAYMLPIVLDVLNPSANIGFNNKERFSFINRIKDFAPDVTLALAVIHHMTLSGNITFEMSAPNRAGLIVPVDGANEAEDILMLIMPVMLN